jgi:hypothetical protein
MTCGSYKKQRFNKQLDQRHDIKTGEIEIEAYGPVSGVESLYRETY